MGKIERRLGVVRFGVLKGDFGCVKMAMDSETRLSVLCVIICMFS